MKLITFGDSWTAGHGVETDSKWTGIANTPRFITNLREQNSWPRWVADKMKLPYVNMGVCGYGNEYILKDLKESLNHENFIEEEDIIVVVFTHPYRYGDKNIFKPLELYNEFEKLLSGYKHYYFNAFIPLLENTNTFNLPNYYIEPDNTLSFLLIQEELTNNTDVWEYNRRSVWKPDAIFKGWKLDEGHFHPNLKGYQIIADYIYNKIKNA